MVTKHRVQCSSLDVPEEDREELRCPSSTYVYWDIKILFGKRKGTELKKQVRDYRVPCVRDLSPEINNYTS